MFSSFANRIFQESIIKYHKIDTVDQPFENPYPKDEIAHLLYRKNWIDTVQWHYEDIIRDPNIDPVAALEIKKKNRCVVIRIEQIWWSILIVISLKKYQSVQIKENATINTESPAWAIDRLSILALKIYHMQEEADRRDASKDHIEKCQTKIGCTFGTTKGFIYCHRPIVERY